MTRTVVDRSVGPSALAGNEAAWWADPRRQGHPRRLWSVIPLVVAVALAGCVTHPGGAADAGGDRQPGTPEVPAGLLAPAADDYPVLQVFDGDTIQIDLEGRHEKVRLQGIDTPEVGGPYTTVECFGQQASRRAHALLDGQRVRLAQDPNDDTRDRYGRLLAYVWTSDGTFVNLAQVRDGYAYVYHGNRQWVYYDVFLDAQRDAERAAAGLWSPRTCAGRSDAPPLP